MKREGIKKTTSILMISMMLAFLIPNISITSYAAEDDNYRNAVDDLVALECGSADTWSSYLNERLYYALKNTAGNWRPNWSTDNGITDKWSGNEATKVTDATNSGTAPTDPAMMPYTEIIGGTNTYYVYSGEQLLYALNKCKTSNGNIILMADIDLNGQNGKLWGGMSLGANTVSLDGYGHTIYNLCSVGDRTSGAGASLIWNISGPFTMVNLNFSNANICSLYNNGEGNYANGASIVNHIRNMETTIKNVHIYDSLFSGSYYVGGIFGRMDTPSGGTFSRTLENCSIENSISFGDTHVGTLAGSCVNMTSIENCYSVGSVSVSVGGHSGGLIACCGSVANVTNCFVDAEVYGTQQTGVFTGAISGSCTVSNCFSSGFVEGNDRIGGFVGEVSSGSTNATINDSYSTAIVGMESGGNRIGSFIGSCYSGSGAVMFLNNCYAAGEVGSTDVDVDMAGETEGSYKTRWLGGNAVANYDKAKDMFGGFVGLARTNAASSMVSCYYDKQTTAMKEWGVGNANGFFTGLKGVLTTDTEKSGNGLMNTNPKSSTKGFTGFSTGAISGKAYSEANWNYSAEQHYPELEIFKNANKSIWGSESRAALVRAYSLSSTSGMILETWDHTYSITTGEIDTSALLPETTYCTVRDLTSGFSLTSTSDTQSWIRTGSQDSKTENGTVVNGTDVLSLKHQNNRYFCDELTPGIEWLMVTSKESSGTTATRRVRVIPTAAIEAGLSQVVLNNSTYDHADDVSLKFSTANRMDNDEQDITTGIFPDTDLTDAQKSNLTLPYPDFSKSNDKYSGVDVSYMSSGSDNAKDGKIYTFIYEVDNIDPVTGEISKGEALDLSQGSKDANLFNGHGVFNNPNKRYLISYIWVLADGRTLQDAKLIRCASVPFTVDMNVYKNDIGTDTLYNNGAYIQVGTPIDNGSGSNEYDYSEFSKVISTSSQDTAKYQFRDNASVVWKLAKDEDSLKSITISFKLSDKETYTSELLENPKPGDKIEIPYTYYRIVYRDGEYFTIPESGNRTYTLNYDDENSVWSLIFDKNDEKFENKDDLLMYDVENDIHVDIVLNSTTPDIPNIEDPKGDIGDLSVTKVSSTDNAEAGDYVTYTITAQNKGQYPIDGVLVRDYVPEYTQFISIGDNNGQYGAINSKEHVTWFFDTLKPGDSKTLSFTVKVNECVPNNYAIHNAALYGLTGSTIRPPTNNTDNPNNITNLVGVKADNKAQPAKTGDENNMMVYLLILGITIIALVAIIVYIKKRK